MKMVRFLLVIVGFLLLHGYCQAQVKNDTIPSAIKGKPVTGARVTDTLPRGPHPKGHKEKPYQVDSLAKKKHNPRKATLYSTFFPGLGQIYNHKYWKLPLVYAAVGIPAYTFFSNHSLYQQCQKAVALHRSLYVHRQRLCRTQCFREDLQLRSSISSLSGGCQFDTHLSQ